MKIQCEVCGKAEAKVLCCADEAVLCNNCDAQIHAANKLSQKHQRVELLKHNAAASSPSSLTSPSASQLPLCDICQEINGYFFCLEDRAILCKQCDMSIHMASPLLSSHQRFLIGSIKVALESLTTNNNGESTGIEERESSNTCLPAAYFPTATGGDPISKQGMTMDRSTVSGGEIANLATASPSSWQLDEILGTFDFNYYEFSDMESSRIN